MSRLHQNGYGQEQLFFKPIIENYLDSPRFVRRDWLAEDIEKALREPDCRFVLLIAEPGAGKSTFMAQLARDHPDWPVYFIRRDQQTPLGDVGAKSFLLSIGYQLAARFPELFAPEQLTISVTQRVGRSENASEVVGAEVKRLLASPFYQMVVQIQQDVQIHGGHLVGLRVEELIVESRLIDLQDLQYMALIDPAQALYKQDRACQIVILVDALDEIRYHESERDILSWLTSCPELPENVRIVLSSRPPDQALNLFCVNQRIYLQSLTITTEDQRVQADVETYAHKLAVHPWVRAELARKEEGEAEFIAQLKDKAKGNLGYLSALARAIDQARSRQKDQALLALRELLALRSLPEEIEGLYAFFLHQIKNAISKERIEQEDPETGEVYDKPAWPAVYRRVLGVLAVARAPLTLARIQDFGHIRADRAYLVEAVDKLLQFLDRVGDGYRLYHTTLAEFLTAQETAQDPETADLFSDPVQQHRQIADYFWNKYQTSWSNLKDGYGLDHLAAHLSPSSQPERLSELICQDWMKTRFENGNYIYDGFVHDLDLAWQAAYAEARRQIKVSEVPAAMAENVRLALVRTSLNSLSANYVPELVAQAVKTGFWSPERALSVARRLTDSFSQASLYTGLLETGRLDEDLRPQAQERGLAAALEIQDEGSKTYALAVLVPYLEGEWLVRGLAATPKINEELDLSQVIINLAPKWEEEQLENGLAAAQWFNYEPARAQALVALAPKLEGELLARGLAAAMDISYEPARAQALAALEPRLDGESLARALSAARDITAQPLRSQELAALARYLEGEARQQTLTNGLAAAQAIQYEPLRTKSLAALAPLLEVTEQQLVLADGLAAALKIETTWDRAPALAALAPYLQGELLARGLAAAQRIEDEFDRSLALNALIPALGGVARQQALENGQAAVREIKDETIQAYALASLERHLERTQQEQPLAKGLEDMPKTQSERWLWKALSALSPHLKEAQMERRLAAVLEIQDEQDRALALATLAPHLKGEVLAHGLAAAMEIANGLSRARVLATLAPQFDQGLLARGLAAVLEIQDERDRALALAALAPHLKGELLAHGLASALQIKDGWSLAHALTALAEQLEGIARKQALENCLDAALAIQDEDSQAYALAVLAPHLDGPLLSRGLDAALGIQDDAARAHVLAALAPYLELEEDLLARGLDAAREIQDKAGRAKALAAYLAFFPDSVELLEDLRLAALDHLYQHLRGEKREKVLEFLALDGVFSPPVFDPATLEAIAKSIHEVCTGWEWL